MASYETLLKEKIKDLQTRAREQEISGRAAMNKIDIVVALADENIEPYTGIIDEGKSSLEDTLEEMDLPTSGTKADLQIRILNQKLQEHRRDTFPRSKAGGEERVPHVDLEVSFESAEARRDAILEAATRAIELAIDGQESWTVIESLLPKDEAEPISVQASYINRHFDEFPVVEVLVPSVAPIDSVPERLLKEVGRQALNEALMEGMESHLVVRDPEAEGEKELAIRKSRKGHVRNQVPLLEVLIPHVAYRIHKAEMSALRLWQMTD